MGPEEDRGAAQAQAPDLRVAGGLDGWARSLQRHGLVGRQAAALAGLWQWTLAASR